jgi:type III pantothenate kinase
VILLLDIGNTTIKWAQLLDGELTPQQPLVHRGLEPQAWMKELFRERFRPARLLVSNVAGAEMQARIAGEAQRLWQIEAQFAATAPVAEGVTHAYRDVAAHGVDRWLAVIAAYRLAAGAACVIDAGTAMTVDGVDARGLHLGGLIVPGVQMMIDALLGSTADIARQARRISTTAGADVSGSPGLLATDTAQAVANGALLAVAAAADRAVAGISSRIGAQPRVFLTGGDAERVRRFMTSPAIDLVPDLVLQGLALMAHR